MSKTVENLKAAFAGESQANRRYLAFAKKADDEDHPQVAKLFRAAAAAETVHAHNHLRALGGIKGTAENLDEAISGESHEVLNMYPGMIADAQAEGSKAALSSFQWAWEVEKTHEALYRKAKENLGKGGESFDYYVCQVCGHTHERSAPEKCPVCGAPSSKFEKVS
ncbi:MAG: rubrerythrin family protein [Deferrisomatales bacterium]|nr:rubrerythrin family protein [Deferrisomatales bacterium]